MSTATAARHTLHEIVDEVRELAIRLEEAGGELTPELEADLDKWEGALEEKAQRILGYYWDTEKLAEGAKAEADRLRDVAKTYQNRADSLKRLLEVQLQRLGRRDVETPLGKGWMQRNPPTAKVLVDADQLPPEYVRVVPETRKPDKRAILAAAAEGVDVSEWAVIEQTESLRIR